MYKQSNGLCLKSVPKITQMYNSNVSKKTSASAWSLSCNYCGIVVQRKQSLVAKDIKVTPKQVQKWCNLNHRVLHTWTERRMAGQQWEVGPVGSPDPEGPWLKCVHLGSSRNRTGCSGGPGQSCEGRGLCLSGLSDPSLACELR